MLIFIMGGYVILKLRMEAMLLASATVAALVALRLNYTWKDMEEAIVSRLRTVSPAILIIWSVGMVTGTLIFSGTIPAIIYYGLSIVNAEYLLVITFLLNLIVATATGTAWGATSTAGVAMVGLAVGLEVPVAYVAGAAISGAIFGDKMSPLSDTTNFAPAATGGVGLYEHIQYMWYTTIPAFFLCLILYFIVGKNLLLAGNVDALEHAQAMQTSLLKIYSFDLMGVLFMSLPLVIIIVGSVMRKPTVPVMITASAVAVVVGVLYHEFTLKAGLETAIWGFNVGRIGIGAETIDPSVIKLLTRGGAAGMLGIIMIIYAGYAFTSIWNLPGSIMVMLKPIISRIQGAAGCMLGAMGTTGVLGCVCGTSYIPTIIVPELFREKFAKLNLHPKNLSRILEDFGTCLNPIWPWSMSGIFYAVNFGVDTIAYLPFAFFCLLSPAISVIYAVFNIKIEKLPKEETAK